MDESRRVLRRIILVCFAFFLSGTAAMDAGILNGWDGFARLGAGFSIAGAVAIGVGIACWVRFGMEEEDR